MTITIPDLRFSTNKNGVSDKVDLMSSKRTDQRSFLLGYAVTQNDIEIKGAKLPTKMQILRSFIAEKEIIEKDLDYVGKKLLREAANRVVEQVITIYGKARIPTLVPNKMAEKVMEHYSEMRALMKYAENRRDFGAPKKKIDNFKADLETTFKFWPRDALDRISNESDRSFLIKMMHDRDACMVGCDKHLAVSEKKVAMREEQERKRVTKEKERMFKDLEQDSMNIELRQELEMEVACDGDDNFPGPAPAKTRLKKTGTNIHVPHDILKSPKVIATAVRNKITPTALAATLESFVEACEGDTSSISLSYSQAQRSKVETLAEISERIQEDWTPPDPAAIHWDGKLMETLTNKYKSDDRLPVLVSGVGGIKLLGVPALPLKSSQSAGILISTATMNLAEDWNCAGKISAMVFDTTSTNTGRLSAGCICIQERAEKALLWCACRKHMGEVLLDKAWKCLGVEAERSPEVSIFLRFREKFPHLDLASNLSKEISNDPFMANQRASVIDLLLKIKADKNLQHLLPRGDYKELLDLTLFYLDANREKSLKISRPGAAHKARWMAKLLYSLKIALLKETIQDTRTSVRDKWISESQMEKMCRFVSFVTHIYIPWWFQCPISACAPKNDLTLARNIALYAE